MSQSNGRKLVDRNMPDVLMVRLSSARLHELVDQRKNWISVDVTDWKRRIARAINAKLKSAR